MKLRKIHLIFLLPLLFFSGCGGGGVDEALQERFLALVDREEVVREEITEYKSVIEDLNLHADVITFVQYQALLDSSMAEVAQIYEEKQQILQYFHKTKEVEAKRQKGGFNFEARFSNVLISLGF